MEPDSFFHRENADADAFWDIAKGEVALEVDTVLDKQLERVDKWAADREARGLPATLYDLIMQVNSEPNKRHEMIAVFCAALWRLRESRKSNVRHGED